MENAAEALKMAADFLVFIIALGISISSFSQAKTTAQTLLNYTDREYEQQYVQESTTDRIVGKETILPTLYRAYKENYKVIFYDAGGNPVTLYKMTDGTGNVQNAKEVKVLDLQEQVLGTDLDKENFMMALLYGSKAKIKDSSGEPIMLYNNYIDSLKTNGSRIKFLSNEGIYDKILGDNTDNTFIEKFGVYYQDDIQNTNTDSNNNSDIDNNNNDTTPDANKQQKRVISYYLHSGKINV